MAINGIRLKPIFVIFCVVASLPLRAVADVECTRSTNSWSGFSDRKAHDSWYPETIFFKVENAQKRERNRLRFSEGYAVDDLGAFRLSPELIWEMLPNGQLFGKFEQKSGYVQITPRKYVCSMDVADVLAKMDAGASTKAGQKKNANSGEMASGLNKFEKAKMECSALGFKLGTEKHGDCVMKIIDTF